MKPKHKAFVNAYLGEAKENGTKAAILAGYSAKTAGQIASQLLKRPDIAAAVDNRLERANRRILEAADKSAERIIELASQQDNLVVALKATQDVLDRSGVGEVVQAKVRASHKQQDAGTKIQVNIGYLGQQQPAIIVSNPALEGKTE